VRARSKYEERYRKLKVADRVPDFKLKKLELTGAANQWDLIKAGACVRPPPSPTSYSLKPNS
jgi:hypothetical protein